MNFFQKILSGWLIVFIIFWGLFLIKPEKAEATGIPVVDISHSLISGAGWLAQAGRFALEQALRSTLATLKKRLTDTLTDEIIGWIQGNGKPKFVEDFGGTLKTAANEAVGEVIKQSKLANFCQPLQKVSLQIGLQEPAPFSQRVSCTLTDVIDNIDDFMGDFSKGGWIGYHELLKPQNNIYGQWLMTVEETNKQIKKKQVSLQQEVTVGQGFLGVKQCDEWTLYATDSFGENTQLETKNPSEFPDPKPLDPAGTPPEIPSYANPPDYSTADWECTKTRITTPGSAIAAGLPKALYSDLDFIASAQDLAGYLGAIADAAINRLVKESIKGVTGLLPSETTTGNPTSATIDLSTSTRNARDIYGRKQTDIVNSTRDAYLKPLNDTITNLDDASSTLINASTQNQNLVNVLNDLITCLKGHSQNTSWTDNALLNANTTAQAIQGITDQINHLSGPLQRTKEEVKNAQTLDNLNGVDQNQITGWLTESNNLEVQANNILNQIQTTKTDAQSRLKQCQSG